MRPTPIPELKQGVNQTVWLNRNRLGFPREPVGNNLNYLTGRTVYVPSMFMTAVINNPDRVEVPCKEILGPNGGYLNPPAGNINQGFVPATGAQRGSKAGMGSTPQHPTNNPVLKNANSFYAYMNADIGSSIRVKNGRVVKKKNKGVY